MPACEQHASKKKGACDSCDVCKYCAPLPTCENKACHIGYKALSKTILPRRTGKKRRGTRPSTVRGAKRINLGLSDESSSEAPKNNYGLTNRQKLIQICDILGLERSAVECPKNGFTEEAMNNVRAPDRAKRTISKVMAEVSKLVCTSPTKYRVEASPAELQSKTEKLGEKVLRQMCKLIFFGPKTIRVVAQSLLASSLTQGSAAKCLEQEAKTYGNVTKTKTMMGPKRFNSVRKKFKVLCQGMDLPTSNYSYRVDPDRLSSAMVFLQKSLGVTPGVSKDVNIAGHAFKSLPIYDRGGKSIEALYEAYNNFDQEETVGRDTFRYIVKLLTRESKAELRTHYSIQLRYNSKMFIKMLERLKTLPFSSEVQVKKMHEGIDRLLRDWERIQRFVMWEYSNRHLKQEDKDISHCAAHAVGIKCTQHDVKSCDACTECFEFFSVSVQDFIDEIVKMDVLEEEDVKAELVTMQTAVLILSHGMKQYMAHKVREFVQFNAIHKIRKELKLDVTTVLLVTDHKQKVFPMKYREGQVEFFGKKAMSVLGVMAVVWVTKPNGTSGFEYVFFYIVLKGNAGQDKVPLRLKKL